MNDLDKYMEDLDNAILEAYRRGFIETEEALREVRDNLLRDMKIVARQTVH